MFQVQKTVEGETNYASQGGGIYNDGSPTLYNCTFDEDASSFFYTTYGGSMYNGGSAAPTLNDCTFASNDSAIDAGGAIADFAASSLTLNNCSIINAFSGDLPNGPSGNGSALYVQSTGTLSITNCLFDHDLDNGNGGAVDLASSGTAVFTNTVFFDNGTGGNSFGGGIYTSSTGSLMFINCAFEANTGGPGEAVYNAAGSPNFINCSFTGNDFPNFSETAAAVVVSSGTPLFTNCILYNDSSEIVGSANVTYSDVEGSAPGTGNINANPLFATNTSGTLQLTQNSPCINVGNNTAVPTNITTDAAGNPRIVHGTVDMGAYEYQFTNVAPTITSGASATFITGTAGSFTVTTSGLPTASRGPRRTAVRVPRRQCVRGRTR